MPWLRLAGSAGRAFQGVSRAASTPSAPAPADTTPPGATADSLANELQLGLTLVGVGVVFQCVAAWRAVHYRKSLDKEAEEALAQDAPMAIVSVVDPRTGAQQVALAPGAARLNQQEAAQAALRQRQQQQQAGDALEGWTLMLVPVAASISLIVMYFFGEVFFWLLVGAVGLGALVSLPFVVHPLRCKGCDASVCTVPCLGRMSIFEVAGLAASAALVAGWIATGNWLLHDVVNAGLGLTALVMIEAPAVKWTALLLCGLLLYDMFWVFFSGNFFKSNVMISVATQQRETGGGGTLHMPGTLIFPVPHSVLGYGLLGLGDLVVPGLLLQQCLRFDLHRAVKRAQALSGAEAAPLLRGSPPRAVGFCVGWFYTVVSIALYAIGLALTDLTLALTHSGQPALVYLVPVCLGGVLLTAAVRGDFWQLWNGWDG